MDTIKVATTFCQYCRGEVENNNGYHKSCYSEIGDYTVANLPNSQKELLNLIIEEYKNKNFSVWFFDYENFKFKLNWSTAKTASNLKALSYRGIIILKLSRAILNFGDTFPNSYVVNLQNHVIKLRLQDQ